MKDSWASCQVSHGVLSGSLCLWCGIRAKINNREITNKKDIYVVSTTNISQYAAEKHRKGERIISVRNCCPTLHQTKREHPTHHQASYDEQEEVSKHVTSGIEWIKKVDMARNIMEIFGKRLNNVNDKLKTLEDFTLEENDYIRKELEGCKHAKLEMRETITSLECLLTKALSTIETMKAKMEAHEVEIEVGGSTTSNKEREAKVEAPKPPMFKGASDAQEVENFFH